MSTRVAAYRSGVSQASARKLAHEYGVKLAHMAILPLSEEERDRRHRLVASGMATRSVAAELGISVRRVKHIQWELKHGLSK
jgi:FixJ family two-component response regulator